MKYNYNKSKIADLRNDFDLKQKDMAEMLGVTRDAYSRWENWNNDIPLEKSNEIANHFNVSLDYLFRLSNDKTNPKRKNIDYKLMTKRLYDIRKEKNISQKELGDTIGLPQTTYSCYETGRRIPTTLKLIYMAQYYNISLDYLVGRSDEKEIKF